MIADPNNDGGRLKKARVRAEVDPNSPESLKQFQEKYEGNPLSEFYPAMMETLSFSAEVLEGLTEGEVRAMSLSFSLKRKDGKSITVAIGSSRDDDQQASLIRLAEKTIKEYAAK